MGRYAMMFQFFVRRAVVAIVVVAIVVSATGLMPAAAIASPQHPIKIVALGDSLTTGFGLPARDAFPAKLTQALAAKGVSVEIADAGVSGDTSSGGLARLEWSVPEGTDAVILELGANDMLRGVDPSVTRTALAQILTRLTARHIPVLLCGMRAAPNLGGEYARAFDPLFSDLAAAYAEKGVVLYPFFLEGVAGDPKLNQKDGLHPTADGVATIVARILPKVEDLIARISARKPV
jgi:acyl-CoA thioesterase I